MLLRSLYDRGSIIEVNKMTKKELVATMSMILGLSYGLSLAATGVSVPCPVGPGK